MEKVTINDSDQDSDVYVQFISQNKFSVYTYDRVSGIRTPILEHCEIQVNPEDKS